MEDNQKEIDKNKLKEFKVWSLAGQLGFSIAIPIVIFALIGRIIDKALGTSPFILLGGILLSIFVSSWLIYKKMRDILS
jgi:F0F1-type ATP synthase assembly protein I